MYALYLLRNKLCVDAPESTTPDIIETTTAATASATTMESTRNDTIITQGSITTPSTNSGILYKRMFIARKFHE